MIAEFVRLCPLRHRKRCFK